MAMMGLLLLHYLSQTVPRATPATGPAPVLVELSILIEELHSDKVVIIIYPRMYHLVQEYDHGLLPLLPR